MGRGLGNRQRLILKALRTLEGEHGACWFEPVDVIAAALDIEPTPDMKRASHVERMAEAQRADLRRMAALGSPRHIEQLALFEHRQGQADVARMSTNEHIRSTLLRASPRAGEGLNPSRGLALLARRGLVRRRSHCGPGSLPASMRPWTIGSDPYP